MAKRTHTTVRDLERAGRRQARLARQGGLPPPVEPYWRPKTRADCLSMPRPCPFYGCRYHIGLDVTHAGSIRMSFGEELESMRETCALDVADRGPQSLEAIGLLTDNNKERIRQVLMEAFTNLVDVLSGDENLAESKRESLRRAWTQHAVLSDTDEPLG